jgi:hypothetical protein
MIIRTTFRGKQLDAVFKWITGEESSSDGGAL